VTETDGAVFGLGRLFELMFEPSQDDRNVCPGPFLPLNFHTWIVVFHPVVQSICLTFTPEGNQRLTPAVTITAKQEWPAEATTRAAHHSRYAIQRSQPSICICLYVKINIPVVLYYLENNQ
jgi:hypothetical protein